MPKTKTSKPVKNKLALLDMAASEAPRPSVKTKLGRALNSYTCKGSGMYDEDFDTAIRELAPEGWFRGRHEKHNYMGREARQAELLRLALEKKELPQEHASSLRNYLSKKNNKDDEFARIIPLLAPEWLPVLDMKRIGTAKTNKKALLMAASAGWEKPKRDTKLGQVLSTYTSEKHTSYDPDFVEMIKAVRPDWFGGKAIMPGKAA